MSEKELLEKNISGLTKLEVILISRDTPDCDWFITTESLDIICKYKRFDLLEFTVPTSLLLKHKTINETYLDFILESFNQGENVNIGSFIPSVYISNLYHLADYYIAFASHDLIEYIPPLTKEELFKKKNGKRLIEILFEKSKKLTVDKIIPNNLKRDLDVAVFLKMNKIKQDEVDIPLKDDLFSENYLHQYNTSYVSREPKDEEKVSFDIIRSFMLDDDKSDSELVELFLKSYERQLEDGNPYALRELEQLSYIKLNNHEFRFTRGNTNCFYQGRNEVILTSNVINTFNHEIGHALYHLVTDEEVPQWYSEVKKRIIGNRETLHKVNELSKKYYKISEEIIERIKIYYQYYYDFDDDKWLESFLETEKQKKIEHYKKKGYDEKDLELLFDKEFSLSEYKRQHARIKISEMKDLILRCEYGHIIAVNDIVDAIYGGRFWDNKLKLESGEEIKSCSGHGMYYYMEESEQFDEIIANYSQIIKSPRAKEGLKLLEDTLGSEFTSKLKEYYEKEIVYAKPYEEEFKSEGELKI